MRIIYCSLLVIFFSCSDSGKESTLSNDFNKDTLSLQSDSIKAEPIEKQESYIIDTLEQSIIDAGLINIHEIDSSILVDLKYSTKDNFMEKDVYGHMTRAYLQKEVAKDLAQCQRYLKSKDSSLTLLIYDAVRPRSVQQYMWDILDMPIHEKTKFVSNPKNGSLHNYGCAVDLTIAELNGQAIDMGAGYDDSRKIAYPRHEAAYLDSGLLDTNHIANRELLREVMKAGGFWNIQTEWWHFNRYNRDKAKSLFNIIE